MADLLNGLNSNVPRYDPSLFTASAPDYGSLTPAQIGSPVATYRSADAVAAKRSAYPDASSGAPSTSSNAGLFAAAFAQAGQAFSSYVTYQAQANYQKSIGRINEMLSQYSYDQAIESGQKAVSQHNREVGQLIGAQRVSYAAQGVDLNFGSALHTQQDTRLLGELDAITIKNNAYKQAFGFKISALDATTQAKLLSTASSTQGAATLLGGGLKLGGVGIAAGYRQ